MCTQFASFHWQSKETIYTLQKDMKTLEKVKDAMVRKLAFTKHNNAEFLGLVDGYLR